MKNIDPIYWVPLEKVLEALGCRKGHGKDMWFSPFREEREPSLHVDRNRNFWCDHGTGEGGTNIQLVMKLRHCSFQEAKRFLSALDPSLASAPAPSVRTPLQSPIEIRRVGSITSGYLIRYLQERKIPLDLAREYLREVIVHNREKGLNFTLLGFPNNPGGYALKSPNGYKSTTKAGITTINHKGKMTAVPSSRRVAIVEGFFDPLSWQVMQSSKTPSCDVLVLNSVNNLERARTYIEAHEGATCFLDNDEAGQKCTSAIERMMKGKEVMDMSDLYGQYNDLNEMLQASRGYTAQISLSPTM